MMKLWFGIQLLLYCRAIWLWLELPLVFSLQQLWNTHRERLGHKSASYQKAFEGTMFWTSIRSWYQ